MNGNISALYDFAGAFLFKLDENVIFGIAMTSIIMKGNGKMYCYQHEGGSDINLWHVVYKHLLANVVSVDTPNYKARWVRRCS